MIKTIQPMDFNAAKYSKFADHPKRGNEGEKAEAETAAAGEVTQPAAPPTKKARVTKASGMIAALRREGGASLETIMVMTGWQAHSVRGFLSGTVKKKLGFEVTRCANADGITRYRIIEPVISETPTAADIAGAEGLATDAALLAAEPRRSERPRVRRVALSQIQVSASA